MTRFLTSLALGFLVASCADAGMVGDVCSADADCVTNHCNDQGVCRPFLEKNAASNIPVVIEEGGWANGGAMSGPFVGLGSEANANLRKSIAVTLTGETTGLAVEAGYIAADSSVGSSARFVARLRNTSSATICPYSPSGVFEGPAGSMDDNVLFTGWVMDAGDGRLHECIPAGEYGYLYSFLLDTPMSAVDAVTLNFQAPRTGQFAPPAWTMTPKRYDYDPFEGRLLVTLNDPDLPSGTQFFAFAMVLDAAGEPLTIDLESGALRTPDGELQIGFDFFYWRGEANHLEVMVEARVP